MPTTDTALVILAGGLGARFGGAKQIEPFGQEGRFLFEYACYDAMQAGFQKVFIIIRPGMQDIVAAQLNQWIQPTRYELIIQEQNRSKPWGTAHALHFLYGKWKGPFLVLNADSFWRDSAQENNLLALMRCSITRRRSRAITILWKKLSIGEDHGAAQCTIDRGSV